MVAGQVTAPIPVAVPESLNEAAARSGELVDSDSTAEMVVKIAKDYHNRAFENIKLTLNAALDHAKDFAETRVGSEGALKGHGGAILENNFLTVLKGTAAEFRAEALELMKANVITTLEYARELAGTTTAAEFVAKRFMQISCASRALTAKPASASTATTSHRPHRSNTERPRTEVVVFCQARCIRACDLSTEASF